jgi:hypothetical protein
LLAITPVPRSDIDACLEPKLYREFKEDEVEAVECLNEALRSFRLPNARNMRDVWLSSFDRPRPSRYTYGGAAYEILGASDIYAYQGDRRTQSKVVTTLEFIDACAAVIRDILTESGPVVYEATLGMAKSTSGGN